MDIKNIAYNNEIKLLITDINTKDFSPYRVVYNEGISKPYKCELYLVDNGKTSIKFIQELCGRQAAVTMVQYINEKKYIKQTSGIITHTSIIKICEEETEKYSNIKKRYKEIKITIEPPFVLLKENIRTYAYRNKSMQNLIHEIFSRYEKNSYNVNIASSINIRNLDICKSIIHNQVDETDYDFLHRVLAFYGYNYIFLPINMENSGVTMPEILIADAFLGYAGNLKVYSANYKRYNIHDNELKIRNLSMDSYLFKEYSSYNHIKNFDYNKNSEDFKQVYTYANQADLHAYKSSLNLITLETEYIGADAGSYIKLERDTQYIIKDIYIDFYAPANYKHIHLGNDEVCNVKYNIFESEAGYNIFSLIEMNDIYKNHLLNKSVHNINSQLLPAVVCDISGNKKSNTAAFSIENYEENPFGFYALLDNEKHTVVYVNHTMPLGGHKNGLFRFPITGDKILLNYSNGKYYLHSYLTPDIDYYNFLSDITGKEVQGSIILRYFNHNDEASGISLMDTNEIDRIASFIAGSRINNLIKQYSMLLNCPSLENKFNKNYKQKCKNKYKELIYTLQKYNTNVRNKDTLKINKSRDNLKKIRDEINEVAKEIIKLFAEYNINLETTIKTVDDICNDIENNLIEYTLTNEELNKIMFGVNKNLKLLEYVSYLSKYADKEIREDIIINNKDKLTDDEKMLISLDEAAYKAKVKELAEIIYKSMLNDKNLLHTTLDIHSSGDILIESNNDIFIDSMYGLYASGKDIKMTATKDTIELSAERAVILRAGSNSIVINKDGIKLVSQMFNKSSTEYDSVINITRDMGISISSQNCNISGKFNASFTDITGAGFRSMYGYTSLMGSEVNIENKPRSMQASSLKHMGYAVKNINALKESKNYASKSYFDLYDVIVKEVNAIYFLKDTITGSVNEYMKLLLMITNVISSIYNISVYRIDYKSNNKADSEFKNYVRLTGLILKMHKILTVIIKNITVSRLYNIKTNTSGKVSVTPEKIEIKSDYIETVARKYEERIELAGSETAYIESMLDIYGSK